MTKWSSALCSMAIAALAACGTELDVGAHDHDFAEVTAGQGVLQGVAESGAWSLPADVRATGDQQQVEYDGAPAYNGGANCSGGSTAGARVLRDVLVAGFPQIASIGVYNCRVIAGTNSMSLHGVGRALDIMIPTVSGGQANNTVGDAIAHWLITHAEELGVQMIIWDSTTWGTSRSPRVRPYTGSNPHRDHLHVEINETAAALALPWYRAPTGPGPVAPPAPCERVDATGIVDAGPCQQLFGPAQYWRTEGQGHGGQLRWTNAYQGASPSNWAQTTLKPRAPGRYRVEAYLHPAYAVYAQARYRVRHADGETTVVVDQGARAPQGGGFVSLGDFDVVAELVVIVEDNASTAPPQDARSIMVDAFRVTTSSSSPPPPAPEPTPEEPPPEPTPEAPPEPTPEEPAPPEPTPAEPAPPAPTPEEPEDAIIDEGDADAVIDADDPGTETVIVEVAGGCAQGEAVGVSAVVELFALLLLARRRRHKQG